MDYLLTTNNITKKYGKQFAVDHVDIHVTKGDIYGLIGRNGAGKTTILKMISGLAKPTEGNYSFYDDNGNQISNVSKCRVGTLIESPGIYPNFSAKENVKLKCIALGINETNEVNRLLELVGLQNAGSKKVKKFSLGMKQRLGIALALAGNPELMILDEPINGLDPQGIVEIRNTIEKLNKENGITFIISSHILEELSKIATRYGIIEKGSIIKELSADELSAEGSERIELITDNNEKAVNILTQMNISKFKVIDDKKIHIFERFQDTGDITMTLAQNGVKTIQIYINNDDLENYYLKLTGGAKNA